MARRKPKRTRQSSTRRIPPELIIEINDFERTPNQPGAKRVMYKLLEAAKANKLSLLAIASGVVATAYAATGRGSPMTVVRKVAALFGGRANRQAMRDARGVAAFVSKAGPANWFKIALGLAAALAVSAPALCNVIANHLSQLPPGPVAIDPKLPTPELLVPELPAPELPASHIVSTNEQKAVERVLKFLRSPQPSNLSLIYSNLFDKVRRGVDPSQLMKSMKSSQSGRQIYKFLHLQWRVYNDKGREYLKQYYPVWYTLFSHAERPLKKLE